MVGDLFWHAIILPLCVGLALSFLVESLLQPTVLPFFRRPKAAVVLHLSLWLLFFAAELALFRRPWFAVANVLTVQFILVMVNNAKFHLLREPFIFQDFEYFIDVLKHPRLYLPFFGFKKILMAAMGYGVALFVGLTFEPSLASRASLGQLFTVVAAFSILAIFLLWLTTKTKLSVEFDPKSDFLRLGLFACLWRYGAEERQSRPISFPYNVVRHTQRASEELPNLVVVQSESFFDVRQLFTGIRPEILREFDALKDLSICQGKLTVPAWGANTVRTEFAFLSGLAGEKLGVHQFNPYRKVARQYVPTMANFLRNLGYRTVCVHPYPASFYSRSSVFPLLGFDEFIDIESFGDIDKTGPYVGDIALAEKVCAVLRNNSARPIFVFVITMENHGPLHLEKVQEGDRVHLYIQPPPAGCDDLTIYLRHLAHADRMVGMLHGCLQDLHHPGWLCWFGDHVPIMAEVYKAMAEPDGKTDYLIRGPGDLSGEGARLDIRVEDLALLLLAKMGLAVK